MIRIVAQLMYGRTDVCMRFVKAGSSEHAIHNTRILWKFSNRLGNRVWDIFLRGRKEIDLDENFDWHREIISSRAFDIQINESEIISFAQVVPRRMSTYPSRKRVDDAGERSARLHH